MNAASLEMPKELAEEKYAIFSASRRRDAEHQRATEIYRILAEGKKLIDVGVAIRECGFDEKMRPKLALARADRKEVRFRWYGHDDTCEFLTTEHPSQFPQLCERVNMNRLHNQFLQGVNGQRWAETVEGFALVPMVPADAYSGPAKWPSLHILWEVEKWADESKLSRPPVDPYLLRRVDGDLFEVLAEWDLTEIERYVMAGRARVLR